jgi:hypothetical protein
MMHGEQNVNLYADVSEHYSIFIGGSAYEDGTECSETSAYIQTPGNYPEESIQHFHLLAFFLW